MNGKIYTFQKIVFLTMSGPEKGRFELRSKITSWPF